MNLVSPPRSNIQAVLFDLDNTMVDFFAIHEPSYADTFRAIFKVEAQITDIPFSGKTTPNIFREVCALHGLSSAVVEAQLSKACQYLSRLTEEKMVPLKGKAENYVLPGVKQLLAQLAARHMLLGVLTGNPPEQGMLVLEMTGLKPFFQLFTFGTEAESRSELAQISLGKLGHLQKKPFSASNLLIVGDSLADIQAATAIGAFSLAVATGFHPIQELREQAPDLLYPNLTDSEKIIIAIESLTSSIPDKSGSK